MIYYVIERGKGGMTQQSTVGPLMSTPTHWDPALLLFLPQASIGSIHYHHT